MTQRGATSRGTLFPHFQRPVTAAIYFRLAVTSPALDRDRAPRRLSSLKKERRGVTYQPQKKQKSVQEDTYYTVKEISESWKLSPDTVQRLFLVAHYAGESGIIAIKKPAGRWKTTRHTLRISASARDRMAAVSKIRKPLRAERL